MDRLFNAFRRHPAAVGETYLQHLCAALGFAFAMLRAGLCCGVHAFVPFLFEKTGSAAIEDLHRRMVCQRASRQQRAVAAAAQDRDADPRHGRAAA